ncbi:class I SAM-dependent methyltransferase [Streptomyces sp. NBC_00370]|uniref:class I SAM-dependent methyltransferase n=1 Tax=Streptomyces sp. NBC_00370 TaxID=2975728 RepID=UPI002E2595DE
MSATNDITNDTKPRPQKLDDVSGWFAPLDQTLFATLLTRQERLGERGDLLEMGVFMGKSAIFLGRQLRDGEKFTVCDLFESDAPDKANNAETGKSYPTLTRDAFESNYLSFHDELPRVLHAPTSVVPAEVEPKSCRFVHVDASHLYEHVYGDIGAAQDALLLDGIVVLDDFRSEHTPGVSVAAWEAVLNRGLRPICLSTQKLYGTWGDPAPLQELVIAMARADDSCGLSIQQAAGHRIVRVVSHGMRAPEFPFSRHYVEPEPAPAVEAAAVPAPVARKKPRRSRSARLAIDVLPPFVTRSVQRSRARKRARS